MRSCLLQLVALVWPLLALSLPPLSAQEPAPAVAEREASMEDDSADGLERLIYVPYKNLKRVIEKGPAKIVLPYLEYLKLRERSAAAADEPPVEAVITRADYAARVEKDVARIDATFEIRSLGKPWAEVPLKFGDAAVGQLSGPEDRVLLRGTGDGEYALLLPEQGRYTVSLELNARVETTADGRRFSFECPTTGVTTLEVTIPEAEQAVTVEPRVSSTQLDGANGQTRIKANLGSTSAINVAWHPRAGLKPEMDVLTTVDNLLRVHVTEGVLQRHATLEYDVLRGQLRQARFTVPEGDRVLDVAAHEVGLQDWAETMEEGRRVVTVDLLRPVDNRLTLDVHTEREVPAGPFAAAGIGEEGDDGETVRGIHAVQTVRETGRVVLTHAEGLILGVERQRGVRQIPASEVSEGVRRSGAIYYRYYAPQFLLEIAARPLTPRIVARQTTRFLFGRERFDLQSQLNYQIERAGLFKLTLTIPEGLVLDEVASDAMQEFQFDEATRTLTVSLREKRQGAMPLTIKAHRDFDDEDGTGRHVLQPPEPNGVLREEGTVLIYAPAALEVITDEESLVGVYAAPAGEAPHRDLKKKPAFSEKPGFSLQGLRFVSAWRYQNRPVEVPVTIRRKPTRLTGRVGTAVEIEEDLIHITTLLDYRVEHAGTDTFLFSVPEEIADRIEIGRADDRDGPAIRQRSRGEADEDGWVPWTVVLQEEVLGRQTLEVSYNRNPRDESGNGDDKGGGGEEADSDSSAGQDAFTTTIRPFQLVGVKAVEENATVTPASVVGELAVRKAPNLSVTANVAEGEAERRDVRELEFLSQQGALAYRYLQQPVAFALSAEKHEIQEVVETVVARALVEIVIGRDATANYRCRYRVHSSERQRLRVDLPAAAEPLGVLVDDKRVDLERAATAQTGDDQNAFYVNVARDKSVDEPFLLTLQFLWNVQPPPFETRGGSLQLPLPKIGGDSAEGRVAVQRLRTAVWVPDDFALVGEPENFVLEAGPSATGLLATAGLFGHTDTAPDLDVWVGPTAEGSFEFPTEGRRYSYRSLGTADSLELTWLDVSFYVWVLSGAVFIIGLVLGPTSWENKLLVVLLAAFGATLYALEGADWVLYGLAAAQYGILAALAYWVIHGLLGPRRRHRHAGHPGKPVSSTTSCPAVIPPPGVFDDMLSQTRNQRDRKDGGRHA